MTLNGMEGLGYALRCLRDIVFMISGAGDTTGVQRGYRYWVEKIVRLESIWMLYALENGVEDLKEANRRAVRDWVK